VEGLFAVVGIPVLGGVLIDSDAVDCPPGGVLIAATATGAGSVIVNVRLPSRRQSWYSCCGVYGCMVYVYCMGGTSLAITNVWPSSLKVKR